MKFRKTLLGFLSVTVLSLSTVTAFAANTEDFTNKNLDGQIMTISQIGDKLNQVKQSYYNSFTGTIKEITDFKAIEGSKFVSLENEEGMVANIIISKDTYILNNLKLAAGSEITGYYDANAPMIMIYPPQYNAEVVVVSDKDQNVKVDRFDKDLISFDQSLKLNISKETEIVLQDGKAFEGDIAGRKLVVVYGASTRSIPAQTNPTKIVVLFEKADIEGIKSDVSTMDMIVNGKKIEAPAAYVNEKGTVMVPLRAMAEALGFDVSWDGELQSVRIGKGISLTIGKDNYIYMKTMPIQLGAAPEVTNEKTYVPLSFFKEVIPMNNAYVFESQIVIDNGEKME